MGALCCYAVPSHSIEAEDSPEGSLEKWSPVSPLSTLLKLDCSEEALLGLDYAQYKRKRTKGFCEFNQKRILSYSSQTIYLSQLTESPQLKGRCVSKCDIQKVEGKVLYSAFASHHKSNAYIVLSESGPDYYVQSYAVLEMEVSSLSEDTRPNESSPSKSRIHRVESAQVFSDAEKINETKENSPYLVSELKDQIKLSKFSGKPVRCIRMVKNLGFGHSELLLGTEGLLATFKMKQCLLLDLSYQQFDRPILSIEYWGGYYIFLHSFNAIGVYNRSVTGELALVKCVTIQSDSLDFELSLRFVKYPALEWSERLVEVLHKQFPHYILLCGTLTSRSRSLQCVIKYDLYKETSELVRLISSEHPVTCINFGPYDNGPITLGFSNGQVRTYDYYRLRQILQVQTFDGTEVRKICFEPCKRVFVGGSQAAYAFNFSEQMLRSVKRGDSKTNLIPKS